MFRDKLFELLYKYAVSVIVKERIIIAFLYFYIHLVSLQNVSRLMLFKEGSLSDYRYRLMVLKTGKSFELSLKTNGIQRR